MKNQKRLPTYFISHGGGPWPYMKDDFGRAFAKLEASLQRMPAELGQTPKAVLVISGHWEEKDFGIMANPKPPMVYDYYGFPEHTYHVQYPAPGSPKLADRVQQLIQGAGFATHLDPKRGFDHGTFAPLVVMYPKADVPIVQLSIRSDYDPRAHLELGRALSPLRDEGVLILGSGLSYHNLRKFDSSARQPSKAFDDWLFQSLSLESAEQRAAQLTKWESAPSARIAHPQEDHLIPLMVAVGAAGEDPATRVYHEEDFMGGLSVSSYRFG
jgi:aromatic ring-opening dioxygenase catalytic subunit (LigB family)